MKKIIIQMIYIWTVYDFSQIPLIRVVIPIKRWYGDERDMYEHLVGVIKQWRKWKEMDKNAYSQN